MEIVLQKAKSKSVKEVLSSFNIGIFLFVAYLIQYAISYKWEWLYDLQQFHQMYKRWSGLVVFLLIVIQWILTIVRMTKRLAKHSEAMTNMHKWVGALSPIFFYAHSMTFGFGYLAILSYLFFMNILLGLVNLDVLKSKQHWIFQSWMITHVAFSVVITFIAVFHIGVVFYYE